MKPIVRYWIAWLPAAWLLAAPSAASEILFWPARLDVDVVDAPRQIRLGDVDGDGRSDLLYRSSGTSGIWIQLGVPGGSFASPFGALEAIGDVDHFEVADLTGEGHLDVVAIAGDSVITRLGAGDGTFAEVAGAPIEEVETLAIADMNLDGIPDLVTGGGDGVTVLHGHGDGSFVPGEPHVVYGRPSRLVLGRVDGDAWPDVLVEGGWDHVEILLTGGDGELAEPVALVPPHRPNHALLADADGDGHLDVVASSHSGVHLARGRGDGGFGPFAPVDVDIDAGGMLAGDLDADGDLDLVIAQYEGSYPQDHVVVVCGNGDGSFGAVAQRYYTGQAPYATALGDVDGDGVPDLLASAGEGYVSVFRGTGDGRFHDAGHLPSARGHLAAAADLDGDGATDLVTGAGHALEVHRGNGDGTFLAPVTLEEGPAGAEQLHAGDANGDGWPDLVVVTGDAAGHALVVRLGFGNGTFTSPIVTWLLHDVQAAAFADLDGDAVLDAVIAQRHPGPGWEQVHEVVVRPGAGAGFFGAPAWTVETAEPSALITADVDGDGVRDLVTGRRGQLLVREGRGDGTFGAAATYVFDEAMHPEWVRALSSADLDDDGATDLLVGGQRTFSVWYGTGDGVLVPPVQRHGLRGAESIAVADVNGDGRLDAVVATDEQNLGVFLAVGTRGVEPHGHRYGVGPYPHVAIVGDLDGDEAPDVLATTAYEQGISILRGTHVSPQTPVPPPPPPSVVLTVESPFTGRAAVRYDVPVPGIVSLTVYDLAGRRVRTLLDTRRIPAGRHVAEWDGRSATGREVAAGVYFVRLEAAGVATAERIVRLR